MKQDTKKQPISKAAWEKHQHNLFRHLMVVGRFAEVELMSALLARGYNNLSIPFADQMVLIARDNKGIRITDLASLQGISKQLCYQSLRPIEKAGYIFRDDDPSDGRAKLVKLTPIAIKMVSEALRELDSISQKFSNLIGADDFIMLNSCIARITPSFLHDVKNSYQDFLQPNTIFAASAGQVSRYFETQLINLNSAKGHHDIRHSFSRVLTYLNLNGSQIKTIAEINSVSNQAIIRIVTELEKQGYIARTNAGSTQSNRHIIFTQYGLQLIKDSVDSVITLESAIKELLGSKDFMQFCRILKDIYEKTRLEQQIVEDYDPQSITIGDAAGKSTTLQNELNLPEILLFVTTLCEDAMGTKKSTHKLTRKLTRKTKRTQARVTFSTRSDRIFSNTTIQPEDVLEKIKNKLNDKDTDSLVALINKLASNIKI